MPRLYWSSDGSKKKAEAKREFSSFLIYELERLGMMPSLMEHYDEMEYRFDAHKIPHHLRKDYKVVEYDYLSLIIHDTTTDQYMVNLSPKDQEPTGRIYKLFVK